MEKTMTNPKNKPYRLAEHGHARIDTDFTKPGGVAVSTPDMHTTTQETERWGRDARVALLFWLAYVCIALPLLAWAGQAIYQALQR
jgi:hypothetical protein